MHTAVSWSIINSHLSEESPQWFLQFLCKFILPPAMGKCSTSSRSFPSLTVNYVTCVNDLSHSNRCKMEFLSTFDLHFPTTEEGELYLKVSQSFVIPLLRKHCLELNPNFKIGLDVFWPVYVIYRYVCISYIFNTTIAYGCSNIFYFLFFFIYFWVFPMFFVFLCVTHKNSS